jgi:Ca-activated chloride channel family protein
MNLGDETFFDKGWFLLGIIIPVVAFIFFRYLKHRYPALISPITPDGARKQNNATFSPPVLLLCLRILALTSIVFALADLRSKSTSISEKLVPENDIMLSVDISKSMLIEDLKPNRLEALKDVLNRFIAGRNNDRLGIVLYAGESMYWCPLTKDYPFLLTKLNQINDAELPDGTAIGLGLTSALNALQQSKVKNKMVIFLTDGENNTGFIDPLTAAGIAKKLGIKVYTIGIGTTGMAKVPLTDMNGNKSYQYIHVSIDEDMLKKIAAITGGKFYRATDASALKNIYAQIDKLEQLKSVVQTKIYYRDEYAWFIGLAALLLVMEIVLRYTLLQTLA